MQLAYGTSKFDFNSTLVTSRIRTLWNHGGQPYARIITVHVNGYLSITNQSTVDAQQAYLAQQANSLAAALSINYQDLIFYADDGSQTDMQLINADSKTGVRINMLEFPEARGPEYATIRTFAFEAEAEFPLANTQRLLLDFKETLAFEGGGPIYRLRNAINGLPQKQLIYPKSPYYVTQSGHITGYLAYPSVPPSKWPAALLESPHITMIAPERKGQAIVPNYQGFTINYSYKHGAIAPLVGTPSLWQS